MTSNIDTIALKKALAKNGSLTAVNKALAAENQAAEIQKKELTAQNNKLVADNAGLIVNNAHNELKLESLDSKYAIFERQYRLFEGFLWMLAGSPSATQSLQNLIDLLIQLNTKWNLLTQQDANQAKQLFISKVLGDYLKCYKCTGCGARFITDRGPSWPKDKVCCPSCHRPWDVQPDDGFVSAMVGEENLKEMKRVVAIEEENRALKPLRSFLGLPCEICKKPMAAWTLEDIQRGVEGLGWGHTGCFNSDLGQIKQVMYLAKNFKGFGQQQNPS